MKLYEEYFSVVHQLMTLLKKMDVIEYGFMTKDGKKFTKDSGNIFEDENFFLDNCRVLQPKEVWKYKVGTCWDQSLLVYDFLKEKNVNQRFVYIELIKPGNSHTCIFFEDKGEWLRFEHSWESYKGILGPYVTLDKGIKELTKHHQKQYPKGSGVFVNNNVKADKMLADYNLTPKKFMKICGSPNIC